MYESVKEIQFPIWEEKDQYYHWLDIIQNTKRGRVVIMSTIADPSWDTVLQKLITQKMIKVNKEKGIVLHSITAKGKEYWEREFFIRETQLNQEYESYAV